jgi:hypothetical protein
MKFFSTGNPKLDLELKSFEITRTVCKTSSKVPSNQYLSAGTASTPVC